MSPDVLNRYHEVAEKVLVKHSATPDEIAEAYLFAMKYVSSLKLTLIMLIFDWYLFRCTYLTGQRIEIDGGQKFV